jgi:hypothetical protein
MPTPAQLYKAHHGYEPNSPEDVTDFMRNPDATEDVRKAKSGAYMAKSLLGIPEAAAGLVASSAGGVASLAAHTASAVTGAGVLAFGNEGEVAKNAALWEDRGHRWNQKISNLGNYMPADSPGAALSESLLSYPGQVFKGTVGAAAKAALPDNAYQAAGDIAQDVGTDLQAFPLLGLLGRGAGLAGRAASRAAKGAFAAGEAPAGITYDQAGNVQAPSTALKPDVAAPVTGDTLRAQPNPIPAAGTIHNQAHPAALAPEAAAAEPTPAPPAPTFESPDAPPAEAPTAPIAPPAAEPSRRPPKLCPPRSRQHRLPELPSRAIASAAPRGSSTRPKEDRPAGDPAAGAAERPRDSSLNDIDQLSGGGLPVPP